MRPAAIRDAVTTRFGRNIMVQSGVRPRALVTGASSGLGVAFAERLAAEGNDLVLVARRGDRLEELARRLRSAGATVEVVPADLSEAADIAMLEKRIAAGPALAYLVNNAGFGAYGPFVEADPDVLEDQITVHLTATVRLARAALPAMIAAKAGAIVNVASTFAFTGTIPMPTRQRTNYAATKAFLTTFTELLSHELAGTGVRVEALCPGVVRTEFHSTLGGRPDGVPVLDPAEVVTAALAGLDLGEVVCVPQLPDDTALKGFAAAQKALWEAARQPRVAARYKAS
jgi:short-subunit dehydrogenase